MSFDGQTLRIEFCVNRFDEPQPPKVPTISKTTSARLVLSLAGTLDLINHVRQIEATLVQSGKLKQMPVHIVPPGKPN